VLGLHAVDSPKLLNVGWKDQIYLSRKPNIQTVFISNIRSRRICGDEALKGPRIVAPSEPCGGETGQCIQTHFMQEGRDGAKRILVQVTKCDSEMKRRAQMGETDEEGDSTLDVGVNSGRGEDEDDSTSRFWLGGGLILIFAKY
jgi:hypothetical protein